MKRRPILLIGFGVALLVFVGVIWFQGRTTTTQPGATLPPTKIATVLAAKDIGLGVTVTSDMVTQQALEPADRAADVFTNVTLVIGKVARQTIPTGAQVTRSAFSDTGSLASIEVPAGMTGIAVQVDQVTGVGTLIKTGDYVDVVAAVSTGDPRFPIDWQAQNAGEPPAKVPDEQYDHTSVKVLIQGIQVIGTLLPPPAEVTSASPAPSTEPGTALNGQQEIVILAVTPQQAEVIKFAQVDGNISLMLRSPKDFVDASGQPVVPTFVVTTGLVLRTMIDDWGVLTPTLLVEPLPPSK